MYGSAICFQTSPILSFDGHEVDIRKLGQNVYALNLIESEFLSEWSWTPDYVTVEHLNV